MHIIQTLRRTVRKKNSNIFIFFWVGKLDVTLCKNCNALCQTTDQTPFKFSKYPAGESSVLEPFGFRDYRARTVSKSHQVTNATSMLLPNLFILYVDQYLKITCRNKKVLDSLIYGRESYISMLGVSYKKFIRHFVFSGNKLPQMLSLSVRETAWGLIQSYSSSR